MRAPLLALMILAISAAPLAAAEKINPAASKFMSLEAARNLALGKKPKTDVPARFIPLAKAKFIPLSRRAAPAVPIKNTSEEIPPIPTGDKSTTKPLSKDQAHQIISIFAEGS